ncbi:uncharacterized protein LOC127278315 [Leptopilina boulardi]|uniref:uncharacterized protein LOC127278315 n=1 Tax=Leptopilina boulardi TaxID=63433 RepID=UPI0021F5595D|nr:uncharacterized protein LOC127278315 [Leptopilina boulardi]XP_051155935.1 uncharacterized protein LOC127278315 [Leptopilina boulardi]
MDVKYNKGKYLKLLKFLKRRKLADHLREKKGNLSHSLVEEAQRDINVIFSESSVQRLNTIIQKYWKKIYEDVESNEPDSRIVTISRCIIAKRKEETCEAVTNYVIKTKDSNFMKGHIKSRLIKAAMLEQHGISIMSNNELNDCRIHIHANYKEIKKAVMNHLQTDRNSEIDHDSNWSEVSDIYESPTNSPIGNASKKRRISIKEENDSSDDEESVTIKKEAISTAEYDEPLESASNLKELVIPLERVYIPPKKDVSNDHVKKLFSPWFRMLSDEEHLQEIKKKFISQYQQKKRKLISDCQMAVEEFITDCEHAVDELFANVHRNYRRQPSIKAL